MSFSSKRFLVVGFFFKPRIIASTVPAVKVAALIMSLHSKSTGLLQVEKTDSRRCECGLIPPTLFLLPVVQGEQLVL